jgi:hypothetical protein
MPTKVAKKTVRTAVREGQKIILKEAKENATSMVRGNMGNLISSKMVIRTPRKQEKFTYMLMTRLHHGEEGFVHVTKSGARHYIPAAIEYGHAAPYDAGGPKTVAPIPFMRTAVDSEKERAMQRTMAVLKYGIESEFAKPVQVTAVRRAMGTSPFGLLGAGTSLAVT